jgi:hypothetical protein
MTIDLLPSWRMWAEAIAALHKFVELSAESVIALSTLDCSPAATAKRLVDFEISQRCADHRECLLHIDKGFKAYEFGLR